MASCVSPSYKLPTFLSDHLDALTGRARENPSYDKAPVSRTLFPKDASCPLIARREIEHLFFTEKIESERVCVK